MAWSDEDARVIARDQLSDGRLQGGAVLPSETQLAARYQVSGLSARIALRQPAADCLVVRVPGWGTFADSPGHQALPASQARERVR